MEHKLDQDPMITRYSRQVLFAGIGPEGQKKLHASKVAIVGMGALGTALANHIVRAGVGVVKLIDRDFVEESNLQRQMLFDEHDAATYRPKAIAAADKLKNINSQVMIEPVVKDLNFTNAEALLSDVDVILDGTDNFYTRFLINDVSVKMGIPWIYGGAVGSRGVSMTILPGETACFRCLYPHVPDQGSLDTCDTSGVIGPAVHYTVSLQTAEALKILTGARDKLRKTMAVFDLWENHFDELNIQGARRENCPVCHDHHFSFLNYEEEDLFIQRMCGRGGISVFPVKELNLDLAERAGRYEQAGGSVELKSDVLIYWLENNLVMTLFSDGRAIIQGTEDPVAAKNLYYRYLGA